MFPNQGGGQQGGGQQRGNLENIFNYSWAGAHLLQISIVKQDDGANAKDYKKQHFCFVTLAPGEKSDASSTGRSFNFQNKVTMKVDADKVLALGYAVEAYARMPNEEQIKAIIGNFSIFVDSSKSQYNQGQGGSKSIFLQRTMDQKQQPTIVLFFKQGQGQAMAFAMPIANALAFADICKKIANWCIELEYGRANSGMMVRPQAAPKAAPVQAATPQAAPGGPIPFDPGAQGVVDNFANTLGGFGNDHPFG